MEVGDKAESPPPTTFQHVFEAWPRREKQGSVLAYSYYLLFLL